MNAFMLEDARGRVPIYSQNKRPVKMYSAFTNPVTTRERNIRVNVSVNEQGTMELNLTSRGISEIPSEVFNFTRIEILKIANNKITDIPPAIAGLHRLRTLDAHLNGIACLPETITNCHYLQNIDLSRNKLNTLPTNFDSLHNLKILKLATNRFQSLPHQVGGLVNLQTLDVQENKLWHLPFTMQNMKNLHTLNLSNNQFETLPIPICNIRNLRTLNLKGNAIMDLPRDLEHLKFVRELNLANNKLDEVPPVLFQLQTVKHLNLSRNRLKVIPSRLGKSMARLRTLHIQNNEIVSVPGNMDNLEYYNVSDNKLTNFSVENMKLLKYLNANSNFLENLPRGVCSLPVLETLRLNSNRIKYIPQDVVLLKHLRTLDIGYNELTILPQVINELSLQYFNIKGNRITNKPIAFVTDTSNEDSELVTNIDLFIDRCGPKKVRKNKKAKAKDKKKGRHSLTDSQYHTYTSSDRSMAEDSSAMEGHYNRSNNEAAMKKSVSFSRGVASKLNSRSKSQSRQSGDESSSPSSPEPVPQADQQHVSQESEAAMRPSPPPVTRIDRVPTTTMETQTELQVSDVDGRPRKAAQAIQRGKRRSRSHEPRVRRVEADRHQKDADFSLLGLCNQVEALLNEQLLQPVISHRGNNMDTRRIVRRLNNSVPNERHRSDVTTRVRQHVFTPQGHSGLLRLRADCFRVTRAGGLFRSTADPNIKVYFPANSVQYTIDVTLQIEKVDQGAVAELKHQNKLLDNILSMGHIVHLSQSRNVNFNEQVTVTIPAPPNSKRGKLHILTYKEDNTCVPSTTGHRINDGYITIQAWHFSGQLPYRKGAVLCKARCKYKACKSVEQLIKYMYI